MVAASLCTAFIQTSPPVRFSHTSFSVCEHRHEDKPPPICQPRPTRACVPSEPDNGGSELLRTNPPSSHFAYYLASAIAFLAGNPTLSFFGTSYYLLSRVLDTPLWFSTLASLASAAVVDLLSFRLSDPVPHPPSLTPYLLFILGSLVAVFGDFDAFFRTHTPGTQPDAPSGGDDKPKDSQRNQGQFASWDNRLQHEDGLSKHPPPDDDA